MQQSFQQEMNVINFPGIVAFEGALEPSFSTTFTFIDCYADKIYMS